MTGDLKPTTGRFYKTSLETLEEDASASGEKTMLTGGEWARTTGRLNINNDNSPGLLPR